MTKALTKLKQYDPHFSDANLLKSFGECVTKFQTAKLNEKLTHQRQARPGITGNISLSGAKIHVVSGYKNYNEEGPKSEKDTKKNKGRGKSNDEEVEAS